MKCDTCEHNKTLAQPQRCAKGHWEGAGPPIRPQVDPWANCKDYKHSDRTMPHNPESYNLKAVENVDELFR